MTMNQLTRRELIRKGGLALIGISLPSIKKNKSFIYRDVNSNQ